VSARDELPKPAGAAVPAGAVDPTGAKKAGPAAQLAVQRSGQLDWLVRVAAASAESPESVESPESGDPCQLWRLALQEHRCVVELADLAPAGSWLSAEASGQPRLLPPPSLPPGTLTTLTSLTSLLWHPRTGALFLGSAAGLEELLDGERRLLLEVPVAALTLSTDQRRLYAISAEGELFVAPAQSAHGVAGPELATAEPERLLGGLDGFGAVSAMALGPAGLVLAAEQAIVGVNIRSRSWAPILAALSEHPAAAALRAPSVAVDHRRNVYLADATSVVRIGGDGSRPRRLAERPALTPYC
jgi:hypothetical protein